MRQLFYPLTNSVARTQKITLRENKVENSFGKNFRKKWWYAIKSLNQLRKLNEMLKIGQEIPCKEKIYEGTFNERKLTGNFLHTSLNL